jgi:L-2-hydroxyglutarate oxidase LhgO
VTAAVDIDSIVIGAGVVGLAVARALALAGREVFVLEACERPGEGISSRNSGVIHAGLYYPQGSLKARLCVRGRDLLYAFCARRGVTHRRLGKLVVATSEAERGQLQALLPRAADNGVRGLRWLEAIEARRLEPALQCVAAIESPDSGIVDVPELVMALIGELEQAGGRVMCETKVSAIAREDDLFRIDTANGDSVRCRRVVNAAGLSAMQVAATIQGLAVTHIPKLYYASGHYYNLHRRAPFNRLIYPLPQAAGLGIHLGIDSAGRCRFGPDVRWVDEPDYRFDDSQRDHFIAAIRGWWPELADDDLMPDFVGVRPKLVGPHEPSGDFVLQGPDVHGIGGLVNLFGIESPGLTSSLAIGEEVARILAIS